MALISQPFVRKEPPQDERPESVETDSMARSLNILHAARAKPIRRRQFRRIIAQPVRVK
jgi:hypothetical protein